MRKSTPTIQQAAKMAFDKMPDKFFMLFLYMEVKRITGRPNVFDDTIGRKMRLLRQRGLINYKLVNRETSFYSKQPI